MAYKKAIDAEAVFKRAVLEGPSCQLSRGEAAALIAARTMGTHDNVRGARNRVAMRIDAALKRGLDIEGVGLQCLPNGTFTCDEIARYATRTYPEKVFGLPMISREKSGSGAAKVEWNARLSMLRLPGSLEECHLLIRELDAENRLLRQARVTEEADRNRQLAARFKR